MAKPLRRCGLILFLMTATAACGQPSERTDAAGAGGSPGEQSQPSAPTTHLAVAGFRGTDSLDERDQWLPLALEESLARRLQRVPGVVLIPNSRIWKAQQELTEGGQEPSIAMPVLARLLGARVHLTGTCSGTPDATTVHLEYSQLSGDDTGSRSTSVGPGRFFDVLDECTRWALAQLGVARMDREVEQRLLAPPAKSPSCVEYYAKALSAARARDLRNAGLYVGDARRYDPRYRPVLLLYAKAQLRARPPDLSEASLALRQFKGLAAEDGDRLDEVEFELNEGLIALMKGSQDTARQRFLSALEMARSASDPYGQLTAMDNLCDLALSMGVQAQQGASDDPQRFQEQLREAGEWQAKVLKLLETLGDVVGEVPAANKLALIYERLDETDLALQMHQRTVAAARKTGSNRSQATGLMFLGQWYRQHERYDEALATMNECLGLVKGRADARVRVVLAEIYDAMERRAEALEQYQLAYKELFDGDDLGAQLRCCVAIAELLKDSGESKEAIAKLREAIDIAKVLEMPEEKDLREQLERWQAETP